MSGYNPDNTFGVDEPYVFVSYSHKDKRDMEEIKDLLEHSGIRYWYDMGLHSGEDWNSVIARRLDKAAACIVLLSPNSVESEYVKNELSFAISRCIPIHILMLKDFEIPIDVDMMICRIQRIKKEAGYEKKLINSLSFGKTENLTFSEKLKMLLKGKNEFNGGKSLFFLKLKKALKFAVKILLIIIAVFVLWCLLGDTDSKETDAEIPAFAGFASIDAREKRVENGEIIYEFVLPGDFNSEETKKIINGYCNLLTTDYSFNKLGEKVFDGEEQAAWYWFEYTGDKDVTDRTGKLSDGTMMTEYNLSILVCRQENGTLVRIFTAQEIEETDN